MGEDRRAAVLFHYFEADSTYRDNLIFFLCSAYRGDLDFFIVISGNCTIDLPHLANLHYITAPNLNNDYGGYCVALEHIDSWDKYDHFFFINSSVRGPFFAGAQNCSDWTALFIDRFKPNVGLVGSTICVIPETSEIVQRYRELFPGVGQCSHVQTTSYALSAGALRYLVDTGFYAVRDRLSKLDVIARYEIHMSQQLKIAGWNLACLLREYDEIDFRGNHADPNPTSMSGDPLRPNAFFGRTLHPAELVFIKTNRNMLSLDELASHTYTALKFSGRSKLSDWKEGLHLQDRAGAVIREALGRSGSGGSEREEALMGALRRVKRAIGARFSS